MSLNLFNGEVAKEASNVKLPTKNQAIVFLKKMRNYLEFIVF